MSDLSAPPLPSPVLVRRPDWPTVLARFIEARRRQPFAWGANDCCTFAADAVVAMTGVDPMADLRHLDTAAAATRFLAKQSLAVLVSERLGASVASAFGQRGDVLLVVQETRLLGICLGTTWAAPGPTGLVFGPMKMAQLAWPVGRIL